MTLEIHHPVRGDDNVPRDFAAYGWTDNLADLTGELYDGVNPIIPGYTRTTPEAGEYNWVVIFLNVPVGKYELTIRVNGEVATENVAVVIFATIVHHPSSGMDVKQKHIVTYGTTDVTLDHVRLAGVNGSVVHATGDPIWIYSWIDFALGAAQLEVQPNASAAISRGVTVVA